MTIDELEEIRIGLEELICSKNRELIKVKQQLAELKCPFKIGERIVNGDGQEAEVTAIKYSGWGEGYRLLGYKIKKNGECYKNVMDLHYFNDAKLKQGIN